MINYTQCVMAGSSEKNRIPGNLHSKNSPISKHRRKPPCLLSRRAKTLPYTKSQKKHKLKHTHTHTHTHAHPSRTSLSDSRTAAGSLTASSDRGWNSHTHAAPWRWHFPLMPPAFGWTSSRPVWLSLQCLSIHWGYEYSGVHNKRLSPKPFSSCFYVNEAPDKGPPFF